MINITELAVGNWIQNTNGNIGKVIGITEQGEVVMRYHENSTCYSEPSMLNPISITSKILEKNGFRYVEKDEITNIAHYYLGEEQVCEDMNLHIGSGYNGKYWLNYKDNTVTPIFYVHQLQNALTLCGINKDIEL